MNKKKKKIWLIVMKAITFKILSNNFIKNNCK